MKKNNFAFTLIEILIWVSISVIIMVSVGVFVTSGIKNISLQKKILNQENVYISLFQDFWEIFWSKFDIISTSNTGIMLKTKWFQFWKPLLYDFKIKTFTGECRNDENIETKYLELQNYNPFLLTWSPFTGSYLKHQVYRSWTGIIGKWVFWDNFENGIGGRAMFLNNPWWLTHISGTGFVSDSGNNRVSYFLGANISSYKVFSFLDMWHWLYQPTGIVYDSIWKELFILNSGKNELWKVSSTWWEIKPIHIEFEVENDFKFDKISLQVLDNFTITWNYNTGSFQFSSPFSTGTWDTVSLTGNVLSYNFTGSQSINSWKYKIEIPDFTGSFQNYWASYIDLRFYDSEIQVYKKLFPYAIHSDNSIFSISDNNIQVLTDSLDWYYSVLSLTGSNLLLKDYINQKQMVLTKNGSFVSSGTLADIGNFETRTQLYDMKIKDMQVHNSWGLLTIKIEYYKNFDCENEDENIVKTFLFKKTLSH